LTKLDAWLLAVSAMTLAVRLEARLIIFGNKKPCGSEVFVVAVDGLPDGATIEDPTVTERLELIKKCLFNLSGYRQEWAPPKPLEGNLPTTEPALSLSQMRVWRDT
jgi:hypothetical protein